MSNPPLSPEDIRLADALRSVPVPPLSTDFDNRVLAALRCPLPWWRCLPWRGVRQSAQPLLLGASCSLGVTLLLHLTLSGPLPAPAPPAAVSTLAAAPSAPLPPIDALLDRPNLCAGSLAAAWNALPPVGANDSAPPPRKPEPRRHAEVPQQATLIV